MENAGALVFGRAGSFDVTPKQSFCRRINLLRAAAVKAANESPHSQNVAAYTAPSRACVLECGGAPPLWMFLFGSTIEATRSHHISHPPG